MRLKSPIYVVLIWISFFSQPFLAQAEDWEHDLQNWLYKSSKKVPPKSLLKKLEKVPQKAIFQAASRGFRDLASGKYCLVLTLEDQSKYPVFVTVPQDYDPNVPKPALVYLHATSAVGDLSDMRRDNPLDTRERHWPDQAPSTGPIKISPQANGSTHHWGPSTLGQELVIRSLKRAQLHWNIDPDQVQLSGVSAGARGALNIALTEPRLFSFVDLKLSGPVSSFNREKFWNGFHVPFYVGLSHDRLHPLEFIRENIWAMKKVGSTVQENSLVKQPRKRWPEAVHLVADFTREFRRDWLEIIDVKGPKVETTLHTYSGNKILERQKRFVYPIHLKGIREQNTFKITARAVRVPVRPDPGLKLPEVDIVLKKIRIWVPEDWNLKKPKIVFNGKVVKKIKQIKDLRTVLKALKHDPSRPCSRALEVSLNEKLPWGPSLGVKGGQVHLLVYKVEEDKGYRREIIDPYWDQAVRGLWHEVPPHTNRALLQITPAPPEGVNLVVKAESENFNVKRLAQARYGRIWIYGMLPGAYRFTITAEPKEFEPFKKYFPYLVVNPENVKLWTTLVSKEFKIKSGSQKIQISK